MEFIKFLKNERCSITSMDANAFLNSLTRNNSISDDSFQDKYYPKLKESLFAFLMQHVSAIKTNFMDDIYRPFEKDLAAIHKFDTNLHALVSALIGPDDMKIFDKFYSTISNPNDTPDSLKFLGSYFVTESDDYTSETFKFEVIAIDLYKHFPEVDCTHTFASVIFFVKDIINDNFRDYLDIAIEKQNQGCSILHINFIKPLNENNFTEIFHSIVRAMIDTGKIHRAYLSKNTSDTYNIEIAIILDSLKKRMDCMVLNNILPKKKVSNAIGKIKIWSC